MTFSFNEGYHEEALDAYEDQEKLEEKQANEEASQYLLENVPEMKPPERGLVGNIVETGKELNRATKGGLLDTVSSVVTAGERTKDMFSGRMEEMGDDYEPTFHPFKVLEQNNDFRTATWWGEFWRNIVHYGSLGAGVSVVGGPAVGGIVGKGVVSATPAIVKTGLAGAGADFISKYNQDANALAMLRDHFGFIDTPLSTQDTDHPVMKSFKQVVEGFGFGGMVEKTMQAMGGLKKSLTNRATRKADVPVKKPDRAALESIDKVNEIARSKAEDAAKSAVEKTLRQETSQNAFKNGVDMSKLSEEAQLDLMEAYAKKTKRFQSWTRPDEDAAVRADRKIDEMSASREAQTIEMGQLELEFDGFGGYKNKPIADTHQGNAFSMGKPYQIAKQSKRIAKEYGSELGSTDNILTPAAAQRIADNGYGEKSLNMIVANQLYGEEALQELMKQLRIKKKNPDDVFSYAEEKAMEIIAGRETPESPPREFWKVLFDDQNLISDEQVWKSENVVAADLVNTALFTKLRDLGIGAREMMDHLDITKPGGPVDHIRNNLIVGLTETKRSRYIQSDSFRRLQKENPSLVKSTLKEKVAEIHDATKGQVDMMLEIAKTAPTDDLLQAMMEAFSMSNKLQNWNDLDGFMRKKLLGETTETGKTKTGAMIRELQGVMINSVLSGPKTPLRAIMGTGTAVFLRPMSQLIGGIMQYGGSGFTDSRTISSALAQINAMNQAVPEAMQYFMTRLNGYWTGELSNIKNRYAEFDVKDEHFEMMNWWADNRGTPGDKGAMGITSAARWMNAQGFLTYSSKLMAATDDAFTMILARARAKEKAVTEVFDAAANGDIPEITPDIIKAIQDREYAKIFDPVSGDITDDMLQYTKKEVTLTSDIGAFGKALDKVFDVVPPLRPFYLFARTGINGLKFTFKHAPIINAFQQEVRDVFLASADDLARVAQYGITNADELANAKAILNGRMAIGTSVAFMAGQMYMNGNITGNGPKDRSLLEQWKATGWQPRSIKLGDVWISYDSLEPFNNILSVIADLGDNAGLMGPEWQEQGMSGVVMGIAKGMTTKTYLQGMQMLMDLMNNPTSWPKVMASIANNTLPLSSLRNEMGRVLNPQMRELSAGFEDQVRNRNLFLESVASEKLPVKYDILNGEAIRDWDWPTRIFNMISPVQLNFGDGPGRTLLRQSGYDLRMSVYSAPGSPSVSLAKMPKVRSLFQKAIGDLNIEKQLDKLAKNPEIQASIAQYQQDRFNPELKGANPMTYPHNRRIKAIIEAARSEAWGSLRDDPDVVKLLEAKQQEHSASVLRGKGEFDLADEAQSESQSILDIYR
jgi:hypothetical protein